MVALVVTLAFCFFCFPRAKDSRHKNPQVYNSSAYQPIRGKVSKSSLRSSDAIKWLEQNSNNKYVVSEGLPLLSPFVRGGKKPRGALISLVRNAELDGIKQSMRQLEDKWNRKYQYPWIFFNDEPFTDEFKASTQNLTSSRCYYEVVPTEHWSLPDWIDKDRFTSSLEYLGTIGVGKGWMTSYHHMCRWNSGFFFKHPRLKYFDWYWRVEPDVSSKIAHQAPTLTIFRSISCVTSTTTYSASCKIIISSMGSTSIF